MNCETFRDQVFDFLAGAPADPAGFRAHGDACQSCIGLLRGFEENEKVLSGARVPSAPADLWSRIARELSAGRPAPVHRPVWAAAAAIAAGVLGVLALFFSGPAASEPRLDVVIEEVSPDAQSAYRGLVPSYDNVDVATAMVDTLFRGDDF